jgi:hypothetical protein
MPLHMFIVSLDVLVVAFDADGAAEVAHEEVCKQGADPFVRKGVGALVGHWGVKNVARSTEINDFWTAKDILDGVA